MFYFFSPDLCFSENRTGTPGFFETTKKRGHQLKSQEPLPVRALALLVLCKDNLPFGDPRNSGSTTRKIGFHQGKSTKKTSRIWGCLKSGHRKLPVCPFGFCLKPTKNRGSPRTAELRSSRVGLGCGTLLLRENRSGWLGIGFGSRRLGTRGLVIFSLFFCFGQLFGWF